MCVLSARSAREIGCQQLFYSRNTRCFCQPLTQVDYSTFSPLCHHHSVYNLIAIGLDSTFVTWNFVRTTWFSWLFLDWLIRLVRPASRPCRNIVSDNQKIWSVRNCVNRRVPKLMWNFPWLRTSRRICTWPSSGFELRFASREKSSDLDRRKCQGRGKLGRKRTTIWMRVATTWIQLVLSASKMWKFIPSVNVIIPFATSVQRECGSCASKMSALFVGKGFQR